jgi:hypothetical protein
MMMEKWKYILPEEEEEGAMEELLLPLEAASSST